MEYLRGGELLKAICRRSFYEERDAINIMSQILEAVQYLHNKGIVHRDLKPENIIFEMKNQQVDEIKIIDFGFAALLDESPKKTAKYIKGTPGYIAPEVFFFDNF